MAAALELVTAADRMPVSAVRFVKELYPRLKQDDAAIERYRAALDRLPPIVVARDGVLVDGFHRWQAHVLEGAADIPYINLGNLTDAEIVRESIQRNASHGQQLSARDKQRLAGILWRDFAGLSAGERTTEIAALLSVSERSVQAWTKDARAAEKAEQQAKAWDLWLNCLDETDIAVDMGFVAADADAKTKLNRARPIADWILEKRNSAEFENPPASRQHFDIWQFHKAEGDSTYFGKMPPQVVENLLWFYTEPGQIVVDPFAGGGTTIEVAKEMGRRVWASDRKPSTPLLPIHEHDITTGWPAEAPKRADFVLLDPPYWQQAKGHYSDSADDLANMPLDGFMAAWGQVVTACAAHLAPGGHLAYIISPSLEGGSVTDHATAMLRACWTAGLSVERRVIVPYQTEQWGGAHVTQAREGRYLLPLYRDLVVLRGAS
jgi:DNA methylase